MDEIIFEREPVTAKGSIGNMQGQELSPRMEAVT